MELDTALKVFTTLEKNKRAIEDAIDPFIVSVYHVRLDAGVLPSDENVRDFTVRVTPLRGGWLDRDDWLYVLELASEYELNVDLQNAGMQLR